MKILLRGLLYLYAVITLTSCGVISYSSASYLNQRDIKIAFCINGLWGTWQQSYADRLYYDPNTESLYIYNWQDHPSQFKVRITCESPSYFIKHKNKWVEYRICTVTYDSNLLQALQYSHGFGNEGKEMITEQCTIQVHNGRFEEIYYKGKTFNVFTDDFAFGISPRSY